jgi:CHASE2 domain-containing sensor protein
VIQVILFLVCAAGLAGTYHLYNQKRNISRLFATLLMSAWTYMTFVLMLIEVLSPSLPLMLFLGGLPVFVVAYGYRYYEQKYGKPQATKRKNDDPVDLSIGQ